MTEERKPIDRIYGQIKIGNEVFSGVIAGEKATGNIIRAFERPSEVKKKANHFKSHVIVEK